MTDELKAGPELDARIATEVMEWYALPVAETNGVPCWSNRSSASAFAEKTDWFRPAETWRPSTDITDAWRVVERFDKWPVSVLVDWNQREPRVCIIDGNYASAETVPLAICKAALLFVANFNERQKQEPPYHA